MRTPPADSLVGCISHVGSLPSDLHIFEALTILEALSNASHNARKAHGASIAHCAESSNEGQVPNVVYSLIFAQVALPESW